MNGKGLYVGIDSGSTSTDVVILNEEQEIVSQVILPTGAGAAAGADGRWRKRFVRRTSRGRI